MTIPLLVLAVLSVIGGLLNLPSLLTLQHWLAPSLGHFEEPSLTVELAAITISVVLALFGLLIAYARYVTNEPWPRKLAETFVPLQPLLEHKYYVDEFYMQFIITPLRNTATWFASAVDQEAIDGTVNWVGRASLRAGESVRKLENGAIPTYALSILLGVVALIAYFVFSA